ncbi:tetratricopeptide repeat protein 8 [Folsomia candida]|uniref:Tetratricopeptide repeat protein 8 n=1 Tax=Folsomia candida TaxID=158441 RepID=A0A226EXC6_FOLCA|nr:tetratricopeptide repeat protein 8 [Folsomia candida]OXA61828.1 Tetratricopeptide repeat protein 8 [Folsomia candida]
MDPLFLAITRFRQRQFPEAISHCGEILRKNPLDQAAWSLKTRALTEQVRVDFLEIFDDGIAEAVFSEDTIATTARPGTSLRTPATSGGRLPTRDGPSPAIRPVTQSGRPVSGVLRPGSSSSARPGTSLDQALRSRATTARPISASTGRHVRLGTASMISSGDEDAAFINVSRLNLHKYGREDALAKPLFEYLFYVENDAKRALELATVGSRSTNVPSWWWEVQLALCWLRLGQPRTAEKHFRASLAIEAMLVGYLGLTKVYLKLDQPLAALESCGKGLERFPNDVSLIIEMARIQEGLGAMGASVKLYKDVLTQDASNIEAIACIGMHHFYTDQPEVALRFYRRLLQMGLYTAELFVNLGLCCFYSQQYDMTLNCFQRALHIAGNDTLPDVWYNLGQIAMGLSDTTWAAQCFRLAISCDNNHSEAYNNLGVLEARKGNHEGAVAFFKTASSLSPLMFEPLYNQAKIADSVGDLQNAYVIVQKALANYPEHADSKQLLQKLRVYFETM